MKTFYAKFSLFIAWLIHFLPRSFANGISFFLAVLWFDIFRIRRKLVLENIQRARPEISEVDKIKIARQSMFYLCRNIFDVLQIPYVNEQWIDENVVFEGLDLVPMDRGVLFMSLHVGSGDIGTAAFSQRSKALSLITKRFKSLFMDTFWFTLRGQSKTEFIDAHSGSNAFEILKGLRRKRGVIFVIDQFMGKPYGVETTFFGHTTGSPYGLALFAQKTEAPVMPLYSYWDHQDKLHIVVEKPLEFKHLLGTDLEKNNVILTQLFNHKLEEIILKHMNQWMWVHRRWKVFE